MKKIFFAIAAALATILSSCASPEKPEPAPTDSVELSVSAIDVSSDKAEQSVTVTSNCDWGGSQGVDETKLPVTMKVDYVRVFQKL